MKYFITILIALIIIITSCNTTKYVPDGKYLLNEVKIENDTRVSTSDLEGYLRQEPNNKLRLWIYNLSSDSTGLKNKILRKIGQAPIIYSASSTQKSREQLQIETQNLGYLRSKVDTTLVAKDKKMKVIYDIDAGIPYKVRDYQYQISDTTMRRIMTIVMDRFFLKPQIESGDYFDTERISKEINRVSAVMRNTGYANFSSDDVYLKADTTVGNHQVDLFLDIYKSKNPKGYERFKFNNITVYSGYNSTDMPSSSTNKNHRHSLYTDTTYTRGITIIRGRNNFLRNSAIVRNEYLKKGNYYSDIMLTNTYEAFSKMGAIKQVSITTIPVQKDSMNLMNVDIFLVPAKAHWFKATLEGTNSAGDLGIAPILSYQYQNLFNGSEMLSMRLKGAYEFVNKNDRLGESAANYYEYGGELSLKFPMLLFPWVPKKLRERPSTTSSVVVGITNQRRIQYHREFFNMAIRYGWNSFHNRLTSEFSLFDINYVRMPWTSEKFKTDYLDNPKNPLIKETYKNQLIASSKYSGVYIRSKKYDIYGTTSVIRFSGELAGWLPQLVSSIGNIKRTGEDNSRKILGVSYAQYFKLQADFSQTISMSRVHSVAYRAYLGVANPFNNSDIIPYEQRFYGGGANGIRGWPTRRLGPGSYKPEHGIANFVNEVGDISLILSVENRHKLTNLFSLAEFFDAGNIWTIRNYEGQEGGLFKFDKFYKQIAMSYGMGIRMDLQFILRLDLGVQLYDPARDLGQRFVGPAFRRMALHFAIGYPF